MNGSVLTHIRHDANGSAPHASCGNETAAAIPTAAKQAAWIPTRTFSIGLAPCSDTLYTPPSICQVPGFVKRPPKGRTGPGAGRVCGPSRGMAPAPRARLDLFAPARSGSAQAQPRRRRAPGCHRLSRPRHRIVARQCQRCPARHRCAPAPTRADDALRALRATCPRRPSRPRAWPGPWPPLPGPARSSSRRPAG